MEFVRQHWKWLGVLIAAAAIEGCSLLGLSSGAPEDHGKLQTLNTTTVSTNSLVPVPAEVASDIAKIASGGVVQPVPPVSAPPEEDDDDEEDGAPDQAAATGEAARAPASAVKPWKGGKTVEYKVRGGDTLMKISFENYGNVYRWREIYDANRDKIKDFNHPPVGSVLTIHGVEYVVIERNGEPYLIRRGDTLGKISGKVYGTNREWKRLWKNNPHLIHNPNKIYAGFTLYYQAQPVQRPPASLPPKEVR